jgi:hypothetical protein
MMQRAVYLVIMLFALATIWPMRRRFLQRESAGESVEVVGVRGSIFILICENRVSPTKT